MYTKLVTRFSKRALLLGVVILISTYSDAQLQYNFERINTDNGLPTNAIKGLQFDEKTRFLWVATESGIVRYNGHGFQSFGDNVSNAALNGRIVFFDKANNGSLFGKLIDGNIFTIHNHKAIIEHPDKELVGESEYLNYKYGINYKRSSSLITEIQRTDFMYKKNIYTIIGQKLYKYTGGYDSITIFPTIKTAFTINNQIYLIDGSRLINEVSINNNKLEYKLNYNIFNEIGGLSKLSQIQVYQNHPSEPVYMIIDRSLFTVNSNNGKLFFNLITNQLPKDELVKYIQLDKITNTIYLGTDNRGLIIARPKYFNRVLPLNIVKGVSASAYAQHLLPNGNIQINTGQIFGNSYKKTNPIFTKPSNAQTFLTNDSVLLFTNSDGLVEYDLKKQKIISVTNDIFVNRNNFIQIGNVVYSFNEYGVAQKKDKNQWKYLLRFKKTPFNFIVYSLIQTNKNEILAATTDGLYKYNLLKNSFKLYYRDKLKANFRSIYNLNGFFLIGTYGGGVYMYRNGTIKKVPMDQNNYLSYTHCFIQDDQKRVWASTNKGLFMSPEKSLIDFWNKGPGNIKFTYFGKADGIDQLEFNGGCSPCAIKLNNQDFSFPGIDGLVQFNPYKISIPQIQPKIFIDKLSINDKIENTDKLNSELSSKTKSIEIQIGISGMLSQENIMLEYKFDNDDWVRNNVKNSILKFATLNSGYHQISITIRNTIIDQWEIIEYPFLISYPWTLHPITFAGYIIVIIILILLYVRFKTIIYQRRQRQLEREVYSKTESLNNLNEYLLKRNQAKDHVIAIMNHDILTPLKYMHITAKNIANSNNEKQIKSSIKQIANTSKELEYLTSNMLNWVKFDNIETLPKKQKFDLNVLVSELLDFVSPFIDNKDIQLINHIPSECYIDNWPDSLRVLLYNLIINAIKATDKGFIEIGFKQLNDSCIIYVKDTGMGMNAALINHLTSGNSMESSFDHNKRYKSGNGVGYQIIRNVIKLMNAHIDIESVEKQGTTIHVLF